MKVVYDNEYECPDWNEPSDVYFANVGGHAFGYDILEDAIAFAEEFGDQNSYVSYWLKDKQLLLL